MAMKRLVFRYFKRELIQTGVVDAYLAARESWKETNNFEYMLTVNQRKVYNLQHVNEGCWCLECPKTMVTAEEKAIKDQHSKKKDGKEEFIEFVEDILPPNLESLADSEAQAMSTETRGWRCPRAKTKEG